MGYVMQACVIQLMWTQFIEWYVHNKLYHVKLLEVAKKLLFSYAGREN